MQDQTTRRLRIVAAAVIVASGAALIASLWLRPLGEDALLDAALGATYLILGIGLWGRSRFSLWLGVALPAAALTVALFAPGKAPALPQWRLAADGIVILCCLLALWRGTGPAVDR